MASGTGKLLAMLAASLLLACTPAVSAAPAGPPPARFSALIDAAKASMVLDPARTIALSREAEGVAQRSSADPDRAIKIATAQWIQAEANFRYSNKADQALPLVRSALAVVEARQPRSKLHGDLLMTRARVELLLGQVGPALNDYETAFRYFRTLGEARSEASALQGMGTVYQNANDYEKVLRYYAQSAEVYSGDPGFELASMNNQANALRELGRYAEAERAYGNALTAARGMRSDLLQARVLASLAGLELRNGHVAMAKTHVAEGLALVASKDALGPRPILLGVAAELALRENDVRRAVALVNEAWRDVGPDQSSITFRDLHIISYHAYKRAGDHQAALRHLEAMDDMLDQSTKVASSANAALNAARFDFANQDLRITRLKAGQLQRDVALAKARQRQSMIMLGAVVLLAGAGLVFLFVYARSVIRSRNEIRAANDNLTEANTALEQALVAKDQFLATTSHEIRTPLNGILGMTQVMLADGATPAATRERIAMVHSAGETMRALVDDILDLAKMETGKLEVAAAPLALRATMTDIVRFWRDRAEDKGLTLTLDLGSCPERILGDEGRLRQVLFNLMANAIKFTQAGGVAVRVATRGEGEGARLSIAVADTGIGIPTDAFEVIFDKFHQLDGGTTRQFGGTGLGLAISRNLAEAMGGAITVASEIGAGSTFTLDLPLVPVQAGEPGVADVARRGSILLTGANPIGRSVLRAMLEPHFGRIEFAEDGQAAESIDRLKPDILVIDGGALQSKPGSDLTPLTALASAARAIDAPTAVLWAAPDDAFREAMARQGVELVVAKPVSADILVAKLQALLTKGVAMAPTKHDMVAAA